MFAATAKPHPDFFVRMRLSLLYYSLIESGFNKLGKDRI